MRAISVLGATKSNGHRKTHQVELGGPSRRFWHLTRGDLAGVAREKSADAVVVKKGRNGFGAKG